MKKEKQVRSYQRKTKSGKVITVKAHTAKYDAVEKAREAAKKKGSGSELEAKKAAKKSEMPDPRLDMKEYLDKLKETAKSEKDSLKRPVGGGTLGPDKKKPAPKKPISKKKPTEKKVTKSVGSGSLGPTKKNASGEISSADFKEWYHGTGSAADKKVAKALRAQLGRSGYRKLEDEAIDNYSSRGHLSMFKRVGGGVATKSAKPESTKGTEHEGKSTPFSGQTQLKQEMAMWKKSPTSAMGKASRNNITKLLQDKKKQGYKLTKREEAFLG